MSIFFYDILENLYNIFINDSDITTIVDIENIIIDTPQYIRNDNYTQIILHEPTMLRTESASGCNFDIKIFWQFPIEVIIKGDIQDIDRDLKTANDLQKELIKAILIDSSWDSDDYVDRPMLSRDQIGGLGMQPFVIRFLFFDINSYLRFG